MHTDLVLFFLLWPFVTLTQLDLLLEQLIEHYKDVTELSEGLLAGQDFIDVPEKFLVKFKDLESVLDISLTQLEFKTVRTVLRLLEDVRHMDLLYRVSNIDEEFSSLQLLLLTGLLLQICLALVEILS